MRSSRSVAAAVLVALTSGCGSGGSETAEWLRIAGNFDETPQQIACVEDAMHDLLAEEELRQWLSQDPETITVEEIQSLPHAIEIADRCR